MSVEVIEVGPRDGLQNESVYLSVADRLALIELLLAAGLIRIEVGSFVSEKWVPQMADSDRLVAMLPNLRDARYSVLVPNRRGLEKAIETGIKEIAVFASASDGFSQKNINCSVQESLQRYEVIVHEARAAGIAVRAYISCVISCPYDGTIAPDQVSLLAQRFSEMGCFEISLGDTTGTGTPGTTERMLKSVLSHVSADQVALHCHDTYGQALANVLVGWQSGIRRFDSSVAGLGGCPYAKGASGNLATEDLVYMFHGMNIETGIDLNALCKAGDMVSKTLNRPSQSKVSRALAGGKRVQA